MGPHPLLREKNPSRFGEVGQVWSGEMRAINPEGNHHMHPTHYRDGITHIRSFFIPRKNKKSWYMYVVWSGPSEFLFFPLQLQHWEKQRRQLIGTWKVISSRSHSHIKHHKSHFCSDPHTSHITHTWNA